MVLRMARPWKHPDSGFYYVRLRIPADVRTTASSRQIILPKDGWGGGFKVGPNSQHVKASLRSRGPRDAKERNAAAVAYLETFWRGLRTGPQRLSRNASGAPGW
jgi:hypothetical protein